MWLKMLQMYQAHLACEQINCVYQVMQKAAIVDTDLQHDCSDLSVVVMHTQQLHRL